MAEKYFEIKQLSGEGKYEEALEIISALLEKHPDDGDLLYLQGTVLSKCGRVGEAMDAFLRASGGDTSSPAGVRAQMLSNILEFKNKELYNQ